MEKIIKAETEWKLTRNSDGTVTVKPAATPAELSDAANEMMRPERPEQLTVDDAMAIWGRAFSYHGGIHGVLEAERKRQAEIAAWDAKHCDKNTNELRWIEAPDVYPKDGLYWFRLDGDHVGVEREIGGESVYSSITHIAGPVEPPKD